MRRSDLLIKIITVIVFIAIAVYIGYYAYDAQVSPLKTALAVSYVGGDFVHTEGYAVRDEAVFTAGGENFSVTAKDGEKISVGQTVAREYKNSGAADRSDEMTTIELQLNQLESILKSVSVGDSGKASAYESVRALSSAVEGGDLTNLKEILIEIDSCVFTDLSQYTEDGIKAQIASLEARLDTLKASSATDTVYITASTAGTFSSVVDGYESISPEDLEGLTPDSYKTLFSEKSSDGGIGKLCYGTTWYYATVLDEENAARLSAGDRITLSFSKTYDAEISMKVESVSPVQNGKRAVVFSTNKYLPDIVTLREMSADIVFDSFVGLRIPKEAVHLDEDGQFVYILSGVQARRVGVEVISQTSDYYVVESLDLIMLHEGSEIIIKANDLYDGKVVHESAVI